MTCPNCRADVPAGRFCVRCGAELAGPAERRDRNAPFAAAPVEAAGRPHVVTTLFPQLPEGETASFRIALVGGVGVVALLAALRLFPIAILAAASLVPLLTALYLYDVDVYEDQPVRVVALTMGWGALCGVAVALASKPLGVAGSEAVATDTGAALLVQGALLPATGVALASVGPLALLRHRRFNDVLDGTTFGAVAAAMLVAAGSITSGVGFLEAGVRPDGDVAAWVARLLTIAVALPVLTMGAVGAATAALWLRYRAPARDRNALGAFGRPPIAFALAVALVVLGSLGQPLLPVGWWLASLLLLAGIALVWLRRAIHLGLMQEASEIEIGPPLRCANCGESTARHTFCSSCGTSLQALPKARTGDPAVGFTRGEVAARITGRRLLMVGTTTFLQLVAAATALTALAAPGALAAPCPLDRACADPPRSRPLVNDAVWRSPALGFQLEYPTRLWRVSHQDAARVELVSELVDLRLVVRGARAAQATPRELLKGVLDRARTRTLGLARDSAAEHVVLAPSIAGRPAVGGAYTAAVDTPQGVSAPLSLVALAAGDRTITIAVSVATSDGEDDRRLDVLGLADSVLSTLRWGAEGVA